MIGHTENLPPQEILLLGFRPDFIVIYKWVEPIYSN